MSDNRIKHLVSSVACPSMRIDYASCTKECDASNGNRTYTSTAREPSIQEA